MDSAWVAVLSAFGGGLVSHVLSAWVQRRTTTEARSGLSIVAVWERLGLIEAEKDKCLGALAKAEGELIVARGRLENAEQRLVAASEELEDARRELDETRHRFDAVPFDPEMPRGR